MKKILLLALTLLLSFVFIACDFTSEGVDNSNTDNSSDNSSSTVESSNIVIGESSVIVESSNPEDDIVSVEIEVPVTLIGEDTLNKANFKVDSGFNKTVKVTVEGKRSIVESLTVSEVIASVDLSGVMESGDIEFLVAYTVPETVTLKETSDDFVTVKINKKSTDITPPVDGTAYVKNGIIVSGNRGMEQFGGSAAGGQKTAEKLNQFKEAVGESVNVYILPCPTAGAFYAPEKYPNSIKNTQNCFNGIRDNLVGVRFVDTLSALSTHTDEYIYLRTDFHWSGLGAYYAAQELANVAGTPFDDLSTYTENSVTGFKGSLCNYAPELGNDPDTIYWWVPSREHTVTYYSVSNFTNPKTGMTLFSSSKGYTKFIYGDSYTTHIKSDVGNGRKLLIFKDSYGNALAPYVLSSFEEVYIADYREFKLNAKTFIEEHGITDVCFAMTAFAVNGNKRDYITKLLNY